jgi:hypothetical protein
VEVTVDARTRSPNYPRISLQNAIEAIGAVYAKEKRAKFPRLSLAKHLGYNSLNGRSLGKIGALRAYDLIAGREDALTVSSTALAILEAPKDSPDYRAALHHAFNSPMLFRQISAAHQEGIPSPETLRWWLNQKGYIGEAAERAASVYLESKSLVSESMDDYSTPIHPEEEEEPTVQTQASAATAVPPGIVQKAMAMAAGTPDFKGKLGGDVEYALHFSGQWGARDLAKLVRILQLQQELMDDPDDI